jgi:hypothetical protein
MSPGHFYVDNLVEYEVIDLYNSEVIAENYNRLLVNNNIIRSRQVPNYKVKDNNLTNFSRTFNNKNFELNIKNMFYYFKGLYKYKYNIFKFSFFIKIYFIYFF